MDAATTQIIKTKTFATHRLAVHEVTNGNQASFAITVSSGSEYYVVTAIRYLHEAEQIADMLPPPSSATNGARLSSSVEHNFDGDTPIATPYFVTEGRSDIGALDYDRIYDLAGLVSGEPIDAEARRPDMAIVAIEETSGWADKVVAICGRIKGIYGINRNDHSYSQIWMQFLANQYERPMRDLDEQAVDLEFGKVGYDTQTDFEFDNSGDQGREIGSWDVDTLEVLEELEPTVDWLVDYMLESDAGKRLNLEREFYAEAAANGLPHCRFKDQRTDEEIIEAGRDLVPSQPAR